MSTAPLVQIPVGIVVERRKAVSQWIDHVWHPVLVLAGEPDAAPWTRPVSDDATSFYAGAPTSRCIAPTRHYRDNLPAVRRCCGWRCGGYRIEPPYDILMVTASPAEGEALTEPEPTWWTRYRCRISCDAVAAFVAEHHVEQVFFKRKRDSAVMPERRAPVSAPRAPTREDEP